MVPAMPSIDEMLMMDPRPASFIGLSDRADAEEHPGQVDVENPLPLGELVVLDETEVHDPGVVDEDVDPPNSAIAVATALSQSSGWVTSRCT